MMRRNLEKKDDVKLSQTDDELPLLKVGTAPTDVEIESEVFVRTTVRGYAPCIRVKVLKSGLMYALIIGAKSISEALEPLRKENSGFTGLKIKIFKKGEEQTSPYVINKRD